jgi:predicted nucleic acid-binding protein
MIAYLDSSVLRRIVLGQARPLKKCATGRRGVASSLVEVECLRTIDRLRLRFAIADRALALRREAVFRLMDTMEVVEPTQAVLTRAAQPLPTELGTLDAIHLATAMAWRELHDADLVMATHDAALETAARSCGLRVVGIV